MTAARPPSLVYRHTVGLTLALIVAGFPFVAALSQLIDLLSTPLSIGMRATAAAGSVFLLVFSARQPRNPISWWLAVAVGLFWVLYLLRMVNDTLMRSFQLLYEPNTYWIWAVGGSIIPWAGMARAKFDKSDDRFFFRWAFFIVLASSIMALPSMSTVVETDYGGYEGGRVALSALNPISLGHLGVQLAILSLWFLFLRPGRTNGFAKAAIVACAALGAYLALASNSRGPLVSMVFVVIFAVASSSLRSKYWLIGLSMLAVAAFVPAVALVDKLAGTNVYDRLIGQSQLDDVNTLSRFDLYGSAWDQFSTEPLTGSGLEDPIFGGYPHNLIIEAFMATGLLGGILMIATVMLAFLAAYRTLRRAPGYGWLALLAIQQIIALQFSGTISQATVMWGLIGALGSVSMLARTDWKPITQRTRLIATSYRPGPRLKPRPRLA